MILHRDLDRLSWNDVPGDERNRARRILQAAGISCAILGSGCQPSTVGPGGRAVRQTQPTASSSPPARVARRVERRRPGTVADGGIAGHRPKPPASGACPMPKVTSGPKAPLRTFHDFSDTYTAIMSELSQAGHGKSKRLSNTNARRVICAAANAGFEAQEVLLGKSKSRGNSASCGGPGAIILRLHPWEGSYVQEWQLVSLPRGVGAVVEERQGIHGEELLEPIVWLRRRASLAVVEHLSRVWKCPSGRDQGCVPSYNDKAPVVCSDDRSVACADRGYEARVVAYDAVRGRSFEFGAYRTTRLPRISVAQNGVMVVRAGGCSAKCDVSSLRCSEL